MGMRGPPVGSWSSSRGGLFERGLRLRVTMSVCAQLPLLNERGLMGHAPGSHSEDWTPFSTSSFPAMGKEEYCFVVQDPPWAGI